MSLYTVNDFIKKIFQIFPEQFAEGYTLHSARREGWLEEQDIIGGEAALERRTAARIIHEFMKKVLHERDEEDWQRAKELRDLYDCHSCVNHVAQVYVKGIMDAAEPGIFAMRRSVSEEEAERILFNIKRISSEGLQPDNSKQTDPWPVSVKTTTPAPFDYSLISAQRAVEILAENPGALLIDVRVAGEYEEKHLPGAVNYPMADLVSDFCNKTKKVSGVGGKVNTVYGELCLHNGAMDRPLLLYCDRGCQSEIAAGRMAEAGYKNVYYFGTENS